MIIFNGYSGSIFSIDEKINVLSYEFLKGYSPLLTIEGFFMKNKNEKGNWEGYQFINYQGELIFSLPNINSIYLPENETSTTLSFPIPVLREGENEENILEMINSKGEVIASYTLLGLGISGTAFGQNNLPYGELSILAKYEQTFILELEVSTLEEKGKSYVLWLDAQKDQVSILEEKVRIKADFYTAGNLITLVEKEAKYGHFTLKYYNSKGQCLWEKYLPPDIKGWAEAYPVNSESILLYDNHSTFFKYNLLDGQLIGLYPFPVEYSLQLATIADNQAYILTAQRFRNTELPGNYLVSFAMNNIGWFDFELTKIAPLAGQPFTVYENREIELEFRSLQNYELPIEGLKISFDQGTVLGQSSRSGRWECQWQSPELIDKNQEIVNIIIHYGPISKNYSIVVKNLENPLQFSSQLVIDPCHQDQLILEGEIKNNSYLDIEGLNWLWELDNLSIISSSLPQRINTQGERSFNMRFNRLAIKEDQWDKIDWKGYEILQ